MDNKIDIAASRREYQSLPDNEWRKDYFCPETGGFVATHILKTRDVLKRDGIVKEVDACFSLAKSGKHILRLPENILDKIDHVVVNGRTYRSILKFKPNSITPKGYPDVFFDGKTWDFKTSTYLKEDTLRQRIKDGRKADNVVFIINKVNDIEIVLKAIKSEFGMRKKDGTWINLPDVFCLLQNALIPVWEKKKGGTPPLVVPEEPLGVSSYAANIQHFFHPARVLAKKNLFQHFHRHPIYCCIFASEIQTDQVVVRL